MTATTADRPLVTFALFAYNQEQYIREAVEGAFSQTYQPLEIILSDDCSSDRTFQIMQEMAVAYEGPHAVRVRKNRTNTGIASHFDTLMRRASGDLVVVAAGDDISHPERAALCFEIAQEVSDVGLIEVRCKNFSGEFDPARDFDEMYEKDTSGLRLFSMEDVLKSRLTGLIGAGRTYVRHAYSKFQPLNEDCPAEDTPALFRCLYNKKGVFSSRALVARRLHDRNLSSPQSLSDMNFSHLARQYVSDLNEARTLCLLDDYLFFQTEESFRRYLFRKQCAVDVFNGFRNQITFWHVLTSNHFSIREKLYLARKGISSRLPLNG